jgi:hypothetical protein
MRILAWQEGNDRFPWTVGPTGSYIAQGRSRLPVTELQIVVEPFASGLRRLSVGDLDVDLGAQFR